MATGGLRTIWSVTCASHDNEHLETDSTPMKHFKFQGVAPPYYTQGEGYFKVTNNPKHLWKHHINRKSAPNLFLPSCMSALRPSNTKVKHDKTKERSGQEWDTYLRFLSTGALGLLFYMRQDWVRKWTLLIYTFKNTFSNHRLCCFGYCFCLSYWDRDLLCCWTSSSFIVLSSGSYSTRCLSHTVLRNAH